MSGFNCFSSSFEDSPGPGLSGLKLLEYASGAVYFFLRILFYPVLISKSGYYLDVGCLHSSKLLFTSKRPNSASSSFGSFFRTIEYTYTYSTGGTGSISSWRQRPCFSLSSFWASSTVFLLVGATNVFFAPSLIRMLDEVAVEAHGHDSRERTCTCSDWRRLICHPHFGLLGLLSVSTGENNYAKDSD